LSDQLTFFFFFTEGEYLIGGDSISNISGDKSENCKGYSDIWLLKLDESGEIIWQKTIGGSNIDHLKYIIKKNQGNYILIGDSLSDISGDKTENSHGLNDYWVIEIEEGGNILWQNTIGGDARDEVSSTIISSANEIIIGGSSKSNNSGDKTENSRGDFDFWIVKHAQTLGLEENPFTTAITIYPNPTKNTLQLNTQDKTIDQINIYTITGSKVLQLDVDIVSPTVDVSSLASGVYYVQLYSGKNVALKKFVKE
ncbi:MAG: T9SS type A sorting domain-containing protein, partial [Aequorivita sp.]|nr:T9SS type A sorting domain-containing protein [Aequorivita sp.]